MDKLFDYKNASKYAYSIAKIRSYETKLLGRDKVLRMMSADDASECFRLLEEAGYNVSLGDRNNFTPILQRENEKSLSTVKLLAKDDRVHDLLATRYDFHNLKVALKEFFSKEELPEGYQAGGILSTRDIKSSVFEEDFKKVGEGHGGLINAYSEAVKAFSDDPAPRLIDIVVDKLMYEDLLRRAKEIGNNFLTRLFVREIDLINIRTFFRLRYLHKKRMDFSEAFFPGGDFQIDFFLKNYEDDFHMLKTIFKGTEFLELITDGSTYIEEKKSFLRFERIISEYFIKYVRATKWISFGIEPIIAYYYAKEKEIKVVRMILTGKQNELSYDDIKEGVPDEYI
ncbi:V-type ATPase subunit [Thermodesulfobacteriota bacterium]